MYELNDRDLALAQRYPSHVLTGIEIAKVSVSEFTPRHISHVYPVGAQAIISIYQERKQRNGLTKDDKEVYTRPQLVEDPADARELAALELGALIALQEIGKKVDIATSTPIGPSRFKYK
ncbi:MAG: hypothetical protein JWO35_857 [Candidatus Saccharibacteria bacterium]|nr:hypothetical protein [Candidatus Saccharibacteria bacterium]